MKKHSVLVAGDNSFACACVCYQNTMTCLINLMKVVDVNSFKERLALNFILFFCDLTTLART